MIQVIDRALNILELLGSDPNRSFPLAEIAENIGLQKTTCANILQSLCGRDYVEHRTRPTGYKLGYKAFRLVNSPVYYDTLKNIAAEQMDALFNAVGETAVLAVLVNGRRIVISVKECQQGITARIKHSANLYRAATGRVIIANYPREKASRLIDRIGLPDPADWEEISTKDQLKSALQVIQQEKFCEVRSSDIIGLAMPIIRNGIAIASIGVCVPLFRFDDYKRDSIKKSLEAAAKSIEDKISNGISVDIV